MWRSCRICCDMSFFSYLRRSFQQFKQCKNSHSHGNANPKDICSATGPKTWTPHERVASRLAFSAIIWMLPSCFPRIYLSILLTCCKKKFIQLPRCFVFVVWGSDPKCSFGNECSFFTNWSCLECHPFQLFPFFVSKVAKKNGARDSVFRVSKKRLRAACTASGSPRILTSNREVLVSNWGCGATLVEIKTEWCFWRLSYLTCEHKKHTWHTWHASRYVYKCIICICVRIYNIHVYTRLYTYIYIYEYNVEACEIWKQETREIALWAKISSASIETPKESWSATMLVK